MNDTLFTFKNAKGATPSDGDFVFYANKTTEIVKSNDTRRFSGVGYTGDVIRQHPYWGQVIFDLSTMNVPEKMPMLLNHDSDKIVGHSDKFHIDSSTGLHLEGVLSAATEEGRMAAALSDEGFPWQMSVRIRPNRIEELKGGTTVTVNGRLIEGPAYIFRDSRILETSFTPNGWDSGTNATALSDISNPTIPQEDATMSKELEAKVSQLEEMLASKDKTITELTEKVNAFTIEQAKAQATARIEKLKSAYSLAKIDFTEEVAKFAATSTDENISFIASTLEAASKKTADPALFGHVAKEGKDGQKEADPAADALLAACDNAAKEFMARK